MSNLSTETKIRVFTMVPAFMVVQAVIYFRDPACDKTERGAKANNSWYNDLLLFLLLWFFNMLMMELGSLLSCLRTRRSNRYRSSRRQPASHLCDLLRRGHLKVGKGLPHVFDDRCSICLDDFGPMSVMGGLVCGHAFHKDCVKMLVREHKGAECPRCPVCRQRMDGAEEREGGSME